MDSLTAYPCCSKANGPSPAAAMHQSVKQHDAHLNHHHHHHHHQSLGHHHQQHHSLHHQNQGSNPVVFYVPNQQQQNGGSHYGGPHQNPYGDHQPQQNHYDYHQTSVANYNPAPYHGQQQPVEKQKQNNYPSIYNNNSKLNLFQPFFSGNIYEEANKSLDGGGGDFSGPACSYTVANSANSPPGGALSTSSGYFSSNSSSPSTSSSVRSTSRCDSARSVESSCSSTDSGVDNNFPHTYNGGSACVPTSQNNNNFVLVPVNSSTPSLPYPPTSVGCSNGGVPVTSSPLTCMQPQQQQQQQRLQNAPIGGASVGGANNVMLNQQQQLQQQQQQQQQQPPQPKQTRTDIAVPYGWRRLLVNNTIVYISPSGAEICSREAARQYLITPGNCKCGLECPLHLDNVFCFDPKVTNRAWPLIPDPSDNTRLCNHKRKQQVPAALLASAPGGPRSPLHRNLIPNPAKDGQQCQQLVNVGGGRKKRRKVEAAVASAAPYDRNLVSQLLAQRAERLENQQPLTAAAPTAPTPNPLELPQANNKPEQVPRAWDGSSMVAQQAPPPHSHPAALPQQMPPPHYVHHTHHPMSHLPPQGPSRVPCHPSMMATQQQQQQQQQHPPQQAPQQPPQYRGFPPPPPPPSRPNFGQNLPFPTSEASKQFQEHHMSSRGPPQRLPPPPYIYPPTSVGGFYPQQQQQQPQLQEKQWQYDKEAHQMAWDDLAKRKKLKAKKTKREAPPVETHRNVVPEAVSGAAPSFMEDPNGYLAQQTALLNSTILRPQNFPPHPTPPPPPQIPSPTVSSAAPSPTTTTSTSSTTPIAPAPPPQPAVKAVPLPSNVTLPKGLNRSPPSAPSSSNSINANPPVPESAPAVPDSASECQACTLIKEETQPAVTSTASSDPKGPIQGGTVSTSQEQQEKKTEAPVVATSTPTKSPLEMVQSVVSSIQVPQKLATATPLTLSAPPPGSTDLKLPPGHIFVSSNGQQLIIQGATQKLNPPPPPPTQANVISALQQPMVQLVNTLPCNTPLLLHQPLPQTVTVEGPLLAAMPTEDLKKKAKKRRAIQQAPPPQHIPQQLPQPQQQQILQSPLFMQNFQQPLLQTLTILPNKQPQFLLPQQAASPQQSPLGGNSINLIQPLNLLNGANFMSNLPAIQTLVMPGLQGMVMSMPEGTLIPTDGGGGSLQLQLPNQILMQPQFGQQNLLSAPQMVIRAPGPQIINKVTATGQVGQLISPQSQFLGFQQTLNGLTMMSPPKPPEQQQFIMNVNGQPMIIPCSAASVTPTSQSTTLLHQNTTIVQQQTTTALVAAANNANQQQPVQVNPLILKQFQDLTGPLLLHQKHSVSTQTAQAAQAAAALLPAMVQIPTSLYNSPPLEQMPPDTTTSSPISEPLKSLTPLNTECGVTSSEADPVDATTFSWVTKVDEVMVESSTILDKSRPLKRKLEEAPATPVVQDCKCVVREGDLVWGPFNGSPSWPGKLVSLNETLEGGATPSKSKGWVRWFGSTLHSQVELNSLKTLSEGLEAHHSATKQLRKGRKMNQLLEKAIQEAMSELDKMTAKVQQSAPKKSSR